MSVDQVVNDWRMMGRDEALSRIDRMRGRMVAAGMDGATADELASRWYSSDTVMEHVLRICDKRIARRQRR